MYNEKGKYFHLWNLWAGLACEGQMAVSTRDNKPCHWPATVLRVMLGTQYCPSLLLCGESGVWPRLKPALASGCCAGGCGGRGQPRRDAAARGQGTL